MNSVSRFQKRAGGFLRGVHDSNVYHLDWAIYAHGNPQYLSGLFVAKTNQCTIHRPEARKLMIIVEQPSTLHQRRLFKVCLSSFRFPTGEKQTQSLFLICFASHTPYIQKTVDTITQK
mmetsp:Transcript_20299/g.26344  ORF Transcript_20299/g.26344 Transcript_20299/m.26344 type:complete len:118 (+) Transcript_20299:246-599(+)